MSTFEFVVALFGTGVLGTIFGFLLKFKDMNNVTQQTLLQNINQELGRQKEEIKTLRDELRKVESEKEEKDDKILELKEINMNLRLELDELRKDYEELKLINEELRRKIDILLKSKTEQE